MKKKQIKQSLVIFSLLFFLVSCNNSSKKISYKCVHCGMNTQKKLEWQGKIQEKEDTKYTCSPRCLLITYQKEKENKNAEISNKKWILKDYYTQKNIDATKSFFVIGSNVLGAMGKDLIPFESEKSAKAFLDEHQGKKIIPFEKIETKTIKEAIE